MPIKADCSSCGHSFNASSKFAGKKVRCPQCKEPLRIPGKEAVAATSTIAVKCECGKKFAAKSEWAGKKVKCPACSNPVRIPGGAVAPPTKKTPPPVPAGDDASIGGLFDEVGFNTEDGSAHRKCPECRAPMSDEAIICIACGYNENTGKKMETYRPVTAADRAKRAEKPDPGMAHVRKSGGGGAFDSVQVVPAGKGARFANSIIDSLAQYGISFALGIVVATAGGQAGVEMLESIPPFLIGLPILLLYYFVLEAATGQTLGKMLTGTKVVNDRGGPPSLGQVAGRTFARLIPFEGVSFLMSPTGLHDSLASTMVVKTR